MGKNPRKPAAPRKPKHTLLPLSSPILANLAKTRLIKKTPSHSLPIIHPDQLGALVDDEVLTCSICLQLFMSPVLAECGHPFCLVCAEDLATYGFACGICHSHQPTYDQPGSMVIQSLVKEYLECRETEEQEIYQTRKQALQRKEESRRIGDVQASEQIDFWCDSEMAWKSGTVTEVLKNGTVTITPRKGIEDVTLHSSSRKLAPHHRFTKEELPPARPEMHISPLQLISSRNFQNSVPMRMDRPRMMGMPMLVGYYWRGNEEAGMDRPGPFDGLDPFTF